MLILTNSPVITTNGITGGTSTATIDLASAKTLSVQSNITVGAPAAGEFASLTSATLTDGSLTYTAVDGGTAGNSITVAYAAGGTAGAESVVVTGSAIVVTVEAGVTTGNQVKTAVNADEDAGLLVLVTGTDTDPRSAMSADALEGGLDDAINLETSEVTIATHGYVDGLKGQLTTTGTLPDGVITSTDYFVIVVDASTVQFASTLANAIAGTAIELADDGAGVHTFTPTALAGATVVLQYSNDSSTWTNAASPTSITASTTFFTSAVDPAYRYARLTYAITAGVLNTVNYILTKSEVN